MSNICLTFGSVDYTRFFEIGVGMTAVVFGVIYAIFKKKEKEKTSYFNSHSKVYELLTEARIESDCARSHIVRFHNGEYFMDGISMRKLSITHESLNPAMSSGVDKIQDIQLSLFIPLLNEIIKNDTVAKLKIVAEEKDGYYKNFMENANVYAYMALPLRHRSEITGYVMLQWCSLFKIDSIDEKECSILLKKMRNMIEIELIH